MKKILIVDDERDLVDMLQLLLETFGFGVLTAYDGEAGLTLAQKEIPDLILLDVMMPKMNGYEVCRTLKKEEKTKTIPVLMLSAKVQENDKFWGMEAGASDYITKPFDAQDLLAKIRFCLDGNQVGKGSSCI
ncbi:MAG: response regulator [Deltaproteobacteria bacterium]|nr:response regulator [Deltaproteobacteria bacterium]